MALAAALAACAVALSVALTASAVGVVAAWAAALAGFLRQSRETRAAKAASSKASAGSRLPLPVSAVTLAGSASLLSRDSPPTSSSSSGFASGLAAIACTLRARGWKDNICTAALAAGAATVCADGASMANMPLPDGGWAADWVGSGSPEGWAADWVS